MFTFKSIRSKMFIGFLIIIVLVILSGIYNFLSIHRVNVKTKTMVDEQMQLLIADEQLVANISGRLAVTRAYILDGDPKNKELFDSYTEMGKKYEKTAKALGATAKFNKLMEQAEEWQETIKTDVFAEYDKGNKAAAKQHMMHADEVSNDLMAGYSSLAKAKEDNIQRAGIDITRNGFINLILTSIIALIVAVIGIVVAFVTSGKIAKPIQLVTKRMRLMAAGDLSQEPLTTKLQDESGQLIASSNEMAQNIRELLTKINTVSETVSGHSEELTQTTNEVKAGSEQVATTMQELASGSEAQANNASELSSVMGAFTTKVKDASNRGGEIQETSSNVLQMTNEGADLMNQSTQQMEKVNQIVHEAVQKVAGLDTHAKEISKLVSVVKDISDQTNLLALNAAIEAARAGEHGRGFAVVADEVRKLAEEVSTSITDITSIVTNIQSESAIVSDSLQNGYQEVEAGTGQMKQTSTTFTEINDAVAGMVNNIQHVTADLEEIYGSTKTMNESVVDIASISEESAAGVEETSAASQQTSSSMEEVANSSEELAKLAEELNELVRQFKL